MDPSGRPSSLPSLQPSAGPSKSPSSAPSSDPSSEPSSLPSLDPSSQPSETPSATPSSSPTLKVSDAPSGDPSGLVKTKQAPQGFKGHAAYSDKGPGPQLDIEPQANRDFFGGEFGVWIHGRRGQRTLCRPIRHHDSGPGTGGRRIRPGQTRADIRQLTTKQPTVRNNAFADHHETPPFHITVYRSLARFARFPFFLSAPHPRGRITQIKPLAQKKTHASTNKN